jgi:carbamate kinase
MSKTAVIALGGNAFTRAGQTGTYEEQAENAVSMARCVLAIRRAGWDVVIVHGNGPQVGSLSIQQEEGRRLVPMQPLFSLGAMTQGEMGSLISLALRAIDADVPVVALVTHVIVAAEDPAFGAPTKPIGPFFTPERASELAAERGWVVRDDALRGFRRVVASPQPIEVLETSAIKSLVSGGAIAIAGGGGGVPVVTHGDAGFHGAEAVIDKDYVAGRLATALAARAVVFVTDVPRLMLDFGLPAERALGEIDVASAERYQGESQFAAGSMGPKVRAATQFLRSGGQLAVITTPELAARTLGMKDAAAQNGHGTEAGTRIVAALGAEGVTA